jgi:hypothetical protein
MWLKVLYSREQECYISETKQIQTHVLITEDLIKSSTSFLTYLHTSLVCSCLIMWPKSNQVAIFALDLKSAYEGEHTIIGLLSLANLAQDDVLQFYPFTCKWNMIVFDVLNAKELMQKL